MDYEVQKTENRFGEQSCIHQKHGKHFRKGFGPD
jgi:hypothetical protein